MRITEDLTTAKILPLSEGSGAELTEASEAVAIQQRDQEVEADTRIEEEGGGEDDGYQGVCGMHVLLSLLGGGLEMH
eukprot:scaffold201361_cov49-Prasinocladus_malaysianus.AAC.1